MASTKRLTQIQIVLSVLLSIVVIGTAVLAYNARWFKRIDYLFYDMHFHLRGKVPPSGKVVLVLMDEKSAITLDRRKGDWSRLQLATAIDNLTAAGA